MNIEIKLIKPTDMYKYNSRYDIYEDMSENDDYVKKVYNKATKIKIVGVVTAKEGFFYDSVNMSSLLTELKGI